MTIRLGVIMDPLNTLSVEKDSTVAMLLEAQKRGWEICYFQQQDIFLSQNAVWAEGSNLKLSLDAKTQFELSDKRVFPLSDMNVIFMRKDPPFDIEYIYTTYLLEHAERAGVLVVNKPQSLRDCNEKLFTTEFPDCTPHTIITRKIKRLRDFLKEERDIVVKPLDGMGGASVFRLRDPDENASVVFEMLTQFETRTVTAQAYIPEIKAGDKRILMIDGEPVEYALARIPAAGELRGNLAAGGKGVAQPLTERDYWICQQVGPVLRERGIYFAGLDVIGDFLTEINVTSPTCIRQLDEQCGLTIAAQFLDTVERYLR